MTGIKPLPDWIHQQLKDLDAKWGAVKPIRDKARVDHNTFKRLIKKGYGKPDVVLRVIYVMEAGKETGQITAQMIKTVVTRRRDEIISLIRGEVALDAIPNQLAAWLMWEQDMKRKDIADELGYKAVTNVNHARQSIDKEMDINRKFQALVFEIEEELERMGRG